MTDFAKLHAWWPDALLLKCGLITRTEATKRGVPHIKAGTPEQTELDHFQTWLLWRAKGALPPRPANLAGWKPEREYWTPLGEYLKAHKLPPPPPPPPPSNPPSEWKNAPWCLGKYVAISHGLRFNDGVWTVDQLIQRLLESGTKSVSPQIGDDNPDPDWAENCRRLYKAAKAVGIPCWGWGRADYTDWPTVRDKIRSVMPLDGFAADVEQRCQDPQLPEHLYAGFGKEMPLAVVATGGIDDSFGTGAIDSAKRWGKHFDFIGQDYDKLGTLDKPLVGLTPAGGENFVHWRSTDKNGGEGYKHLPGAEGRWHIPQGMSDAETCPSMEAQRADWKDWSPFIGWWDGEIIESNNEWGVWASL